VNKIIRRRAFQISPSNRLSFLGPPYDIPQSVRNPESSLKSVMTAFSKSLSTIFHDVSRHFRSYMTSAVSTESLNKLINSKMNDMTVISLVVKLLTYHRNTYYIKWYFIYF